MDAADVARAELDAWSSLDVDGIMAHFAPHAVWDGVPGSPPISGYDAIRQAVEGFVARMEHADLHVAHLAVDGNVVLTERVDSFVFDGARLEARVMGVMEIADDKITAWRDYFDTAR